MSEKTVRRAGKEAELFDKLPDEEKSEIMSGKTTITKAKRKQKKGAAEKRGNAAQCYI